MGAGYSLSKYSSADAVEDENIADYDELPVVVSPYSAVTSQTPWSYSSSSSASSSSSSQSLSQWWRADRGFQIFGTNTYNENTGTGNVCSYDVAVTDESERASVFRLLDDDVVLEIMSYVAIGPCEKDCSDESSMGTLIQVLPFVSRRFYRLCLSSSLLWMKALIRLVINGDNSGISYDDAGGKKSADWIERGLLELLGYGHTRPPWSCYHDASNDGNDFLLASEVKNFKRCCCHRKDSMSSLLWDQEVKEEEKVAKEANRLLRQVCDSVIVRMDAKDYGHSDVQAINVKRKCSLFGIEESKERRLYLSLVRDYAVFILPIFHARSGVSGTSSPLNIGQSRKIRLTGEGHHRSLIEKLIEGRLESELRWGPKWIYEPRPQFLMMQDSGETRGGLSASRSYIMEVLKLKMLPDNGAYVLARAMKRTVPLRIARRIATVGGSHDENDRVVHYDAQLKRFHTEKLSEK